MLPRGHILASGIISICVWAYFRSIGCALISFAAGVLLDIDHLLDYCANYTFTFRIKTMYEAFMNFKLNRLYIVLHSYEFIALSWVAIFAFGLSDLWKALIIGYTQHVLLDQVTNPVKPLAYFLTYRISRGFKKEDILRLTR